MILWIYRGYVARIEEEPVPTVKQHRDGNEYFQIRRKNIDFAICPEWRRTLRLDRNEEGHLLKIDLSPGRRRGIKVEFAIGEDGFFRVRPHGTNPANGFPFYWGDVPTPLKGHMERNELLNSTATEGNPAIWTWKQEGRWRFVAVD